MAERGKTADVKPDDSDRRLGLREKAYQVIKDGILTCRFKPGESIDEVTVASLFNIGRTPVHQALSRLHQEGLVKVKPRKGVIVSPLVLPDVLQVVEARVLNETRCARFAAERADGRDIARLRATVDGAAKAIKNRDVVTMMGFDRQFHRQMAEASKNEVLVQIVCNLSERSLRFWFVSFTSDHHQKFQDQHIAILEAIRAHDGAAAERAMSAHLGSFRKNVLRKLS